MRAARTRPPCSRPRRPRRRPRQTVLPSPGSTASCGGSSKKGGIGHPRKANRAASCLNHNRMNCGPPFLSHSLPALDHRSSYNSRACKGKGEPLDDSEHLQVELAKILERNLDGICFVTG